MAEAFARLPHVPRYLASEGGFSTLLGNHTYGLVIDLRVAIFRSSISEFHELIFVVKEDHMWKTLLSQKR